MTTFACVFVKGHVPFTVDYVAKLRRMVAKHAGRPHRFICLTDRPRRIPHGVEAIEVPGVNGMFAWWRKVLLFSDQMPPEGRIVYLDLDTVVVSSLAPIIDYPSPFALIPHEGRFEGRGARAVVKRFNSSVMVWDAGTLRHLSANWTPAVAKRLWGDQDWIGEQVEQADTMPGEWFPRLSQIEGSGPSADAKVILAKTPKNHIAARKYPWFGPLWRAA